MPRLLIITGTILGLVFGLRSHAAAGDSAVTLTSRFGVRTVKDLAYYDAKDADPIKHKLDLYLPKDQKDFPVILFVHGGGWQNGDKDSHLGVYRGLASFLARHGVGVVVTNYRLSPAVKHPEHIRDVARAFAWTYRHIAEYGGDPDRLFISGHSAGGHLVSLLATDDRYLKALGLTRTNIRGVISVSGVYHLGDGTFPKVFGTDPKEREMAWPLGHVTSGLPPFLVLYADKDYKGCDRGPAEAFCKAVRDKGNEVKSLEAHDSDHFKILFSMAIPNDPVSRRIITFIQAHAAQRP